MNITCFGDSNNHLSHFTYSSSVMTLRSHFFFIYLTCSLHA